MSKMSKKIGREVVVAEQTKAPIISFEQALADGMFGYEIRAMAAALERKAKNRDGQQVSFVGPKENFDNAYHLRKLARALDNWYKSEGTLNAESIRDEERADLASINMARGIGTVGGHYCEVTTMLLRAEEGVDADLEWMDWEPDDWNEYEQVEEHRNEVLGNIGIATFNIE